MPNDKLLAKLDEVRARSDETRNILIGILCERQPWSLHVPANPDDPDLRVADMHETVDKMDRLIRAQIEWITCKRELEEAVKRCDASGNDGADVWEAQQWDERLKQAEFSLAAIIKDFCEGDEE